jgi:hypothetical protein
MCPALDVERHTTCSTPAPFATLLVEPTPTLVPQLDFTPRFNRSVRPNSSKFSPPTRSPLNGFPAGQLHNRQHRTYRSYVQGSPERPASISEASCGPLLVSAELRSGCLGVRPNIRGGETDTPSACGRAVSELAQSFATENDNPLSGPIDVGSHFSAKGQ